MSHLTGPKIEPRPIAPIEMLLPLRKLAGGKQGLKSKMNLGGITSTASGPLTTTTRQALRMLKVVATAITICAWPTTGNPKENWPAE